MDPASQLRRAARGLCGWLLALMLVFPASARGAEFSALMMVKDGDKVISGKILMQNNKMRQEFNDAEGQTVTIVRPDKKVVWLVSPLKRTYLELPLKAQLPGQFIQIPPDALQKRRVGQECVNGYEADKYEFMVRNKTGLEKQTAWVAQKLAVPIKMIAGERRFSLEYKSIKEGAQADRLFELPPGYQKMTTPEGFTSKMLE